MILKKSLTKILFIVSVTIFLNSSSSLYSQDTTQNLHSLLTKAYETISTNPQEAISLFQQASLIAPTDVQIKKQLGYLFLEQDKKSEAIEQFVAADQLAPSDTIKLQLAYLYNSLERNDEALAYFRQLENSDDPDIREKSQAAVIVLGTDEGLQKHPWWGEVYASPYYDSRFESIFSFIQVREGFSIVGNKLVSVFGSFEISGDTKSKSGNTEQPPIIFSDNAAILGLGLVSNPLAGLRIFIQGGIGIDLIKSENSSRIKEDFRALITYGNGIYPEISTPAVVRFGFKPFADVYGSCGYYSRYSNLIGFSTGKAGGRIVEWKKSALDIFARIDVTRDTKKQFYNNVVEWGGGVRIIPHHTFGLSFLAEFHRGTYWKVGNEPIPYPSYYNSYRLFIIFGRLL
ncbi:MAG: hypothetical protein Q8K98_12445 [Bacteroidota bacterium]|nr:hypothetical protein [Bacteroidota bacterium]